MENVLYRDTSLRYSKDDRAESMIVPVHLRPHQTTTLCIQHKCDTMAKKLIQDIRGDSEKIQLC